MHLAAKRDVDFTVSGHSFAIEKGETIHTENSRKYRPEEADMLLRAGGWSRIAHWTDELAYFSVILAAYDVPTASVETEQAAPLKRHAAIASK
jgi:uncharacterized SAM-dependent methyltransferase